MKTLLIILGILEIVIGVSLVFGYRLSTTNQVILIICYGITLILLALK